MTHAVQIAIVHLDQRMMNKPRVLRWPKAIDLSTGISLLQYDRASPMTMNIDLSMPVDMYYFELYSTWVDLYPTKCTKNGESH